MYSTFFNVGIYKPSIDKTEKLKTEESEMKEYETNVPNLDIRNRYLPVYSRSRCFEFRESLDPNTCLDNFQIDNTLKQWELESGENMTMRFKAIPYQMIDFAKYDTELVHLDMNELHDQDYQSFGVVINTDVTTGRGKYWFCLYGDMSGVGSKDDPWYIEYFNPHGNLPMNEVIDWMEIQKINMKKKYGKRIEIVYAVRYKIHPLAYIYKRLKHNNV